MEHHLRKTSASCEIQPADQLTESNEVYEQALSRARVFCEVQHMYERSKEIRS